MKVKLSDCPIIPSRGAGVAFEKQDIAELESGDLKVATAVVDLFNTEAAATPIEDAVPANQVAYEKVCSKLLATNAKLPKEYLAIA